MLYFDNQPLHEVVKISNPEGVASRIEVLVKKLQDLIIRGEPLSFDELIGTEAAGAQVAIGMAYCIRCWALSTLGVMTAAYVVSQLFIKLPFLPRRVRPVVFEGQSISTCSACGACSDKICRWRSWFCATTEHDGGSDAPLYAKSDLLRLAGAGSEHVDLVLQGPGPVVRNGRGWRADRCRAQSGYPSAPRLAPHPGLLHPRPPLLLLRRAHLRRRTRRVRDRRLGRRPRAVLHPHLGGGA